jgi:hypothetical protein
MVSFKTLCRIRISRFVCEECGGTGVCPVCHGDESSARCVCSTVMVAGTFHLGTTSGTPGKCQYCQGRGWRRGFGLAVGGPDS